MKTLTTLSIAAGMAFMAATVSAQTTAPANPMPQSKGNMPSPDQMAQKQTDQIKQNVTGITPDQESKILAVEQNFSKGMMDAHNSSNGDHDAMHAKMDALRKDRDTKIQSILTDNQLVQYKKMGQTHPMGAPKTGN